MQNINPKYYALSIDKAGDRNHNGEDSETRTENGTKTKVIQGSFAH